MKISISLENTITNDVSIMVDALRASTTITLALDKFNKIIPCFTPEEAFEIAKNKNCLIAGEREGKKIENFDIGNSPYTIQNLEKTNKDLILTTSNGTRILKNMDSTILIGSFINAKAVAQKSLEIANDEIDIVMAGYKGEFTIEDFLASCEIVSEILKENPKVELNDLALLGTQINIKDIIYKSRSAQRLLKLGYKKDIEICLLKNKSENVAIYKNQILKKM